MKDKMFTSNFDAKEVVKFLNNISTKFKDLSPLMKTTRVFLKKTVDDNFETQGEATGEKWREWSDGWKRRRIKLGRGDGKILNLDGHLRRDIRAKSAKDYALVGTNKQYAAIHNFGFDKKIRLKSKKGKIFYRRLNMPKREFMRLNDYKKEELLALLYLKTEEMLMESISQGEATTR